MTSLLGIHVEMDLIMIPRPNHEYATQYTRHTHTYIIYIYIYIYIIGLLALDFICRCWYECSLIYVIRAGLVVRRTIDKTVNANYFAGLKFACSSLVLSMSRVISREQG